MDFFEIISRIWKFYRIFWNFQWIKKIIIKNLLEFAMNLEKKVKKIIC